MDWFLRFLAGFSTFPLAIAYRGTVVDPHVARARGGNTVGKGNYWVEVGFDEVIHKTDLAVLFDIGGEEVWIPISQMRYEEYDEGDSTFEIPEWLALEKGLI